MQNIQKIKKIQTEILELKGVSTLLRNEINSVQPLSDIEVHLFETECLDVDEVQMIFASFILANKNKFSETEISALERANHIISNKQDKIDRKKTDLNEKLDVNEKKIGRLYQNICKIVQTELNTEEMHCYMKHISLSDLGNHLPILIDTLENEGQHFLIIDDKTIVFLESRNPYVDIVDLIQANIKNIDPEFDIKAVTKKSPLPYFDKTFITLFYGE